MMSNVPYEIRILGPGDAGVLANVAAEVFDRGVDMARTAEFLADPRHHLAVAIDVAIHASGGMVVGFASAVHYVHPDKPAEMWINEVGVAASHRQQVVLIGRDLPRSWIPAANAPPSPRGLAGRRRAGL